jgi:hypothetical protein
MLRPIRRAHLFIWSALTVLLPLVIAVAIRARN